MQAAGATAAISPRSEGGFRALTLADEGAAAAVAAAAAAAVAAAAATGAARRD